MSLASRKAANGYEKSSSVTIRLVAKQITPTAGSGWQGKAVGNGLETAVNRFAESGLAGMVKREEMHENRGK